MIIMYERKKKKREREREWRVRGERERTGLLRNVMKRRRGSNTFIASCGGAARCDRASKLPLMVFAPIKGKKKKKGKTSAVDNNCGT